MASATPRDKHRPGHVTDHPRSDPRPASQPSHNGLHPAAQTAAAALQQRARPHVPRAPFRDAWPQCPPPQIRPKNSTKNRLVFVDLLRPEIHYCAAGVNLSFPNPPFLTSVWSGQAAVARSPSLHSQRAGSLHFPLINEARPPPGEGRGGPPAGPAHPAAVLRDEQCAAQGPRPVSD